MSAYQRQLRPIVKEALREFLTDHTCDRRSSRSWITQTYPDYIIEDGFSEQDMLWSAETPETVEEHRVRKRMLLEDIFENDDAHVISLTTHSYAISAILNVINGPTFRVSEGTIVPLFIKAERITANVE